MTLFLPWADQAIDDSAAVIAMDHEQASRRLAVATYSAVAIRDSDCHCLPALSAFSRSAESTSGLGPNSWMRWVSAARLAFGTASGSIFISAIAESGAISPPLECRIGRVVTATFAIHGSLGVGTADGRLFFLSADAVVLYSIGLPALSGGIREASFHQKSTLACVSGGQAFFLTVDRAQFELKRAPITKPLRLLNVASVAPNFGASLLAVAANDGSLALLSTGEPRPPVTLCSPAPTDRVLCLFWSPDPAVLVAVRDSGAIELYLPRGKLLASTTFPKAASAIAACFDAGSSRLFLSDMQSVTAVHFARQFAHFTASCCAVTDALTSSVVWHSAEGDLFPLSLVVPDPLSDAIFLASWRKFTLASHETAVAARAINAAFLDSFLLVFREPAPSEYCLDFYRPDLTLAASAPFPHRPVSVSTIGSVAIASWERQFTVVHFTEDPARTIEVDGRFVALASYYAPDPIVGAWPIGSGDVAVHHRTGDVRMAISEKVVATGVQACWFVSAPPILVMQRSDGVMVLIGGVTLHFDLEPVMVTELAMYVLEPAMEFGRPEFRMRQYASYLVSAAIENPIIFDEVIRAYQKFEYFLKLIAQAFIHALEAGQDDKWIGWIMENLSAEQIVQVLDVVAPSLEHCPSIFNREQMKWETYFARLCPSAQSAFLIGVAPERFAALPLESVEPAFIENALSKREILRAFLCSVARKVDFCPFVLRDSQLPGLAIVDAIALFEKEIAKFSRVENIVATCRFLGSALQIGGLERLALSVYLALRDKRRIASLFVVSEALVGIAREYLAGQPEGEIAALLQEGIADE
jgi:WD40 repeat protein